MKKLLKALAVSLAALAMLTSFVSCGGGAGEDPTDWPVETITVPGGKIEWSVFEITEYTKLAKPGAKLHLSIAKTTDDGGNEYCKVQILTKDWQDSGITEIMNEGFTTNVISYQTDDDGNPVHRPQIEDEGDYVIVLNADSLSKDSLALMGNAKVKSLKIEYVDGKKEVTPAGGPEEPDSIYAKYTVTPTEAAEAGQVGYLLQIANDGTQNAEGLKIEVSNLKIGIKVGNGNWETKDLGTVNMIPDQHSTPAYSKTSCRTVLPGVSFEANTAVQVKVISATVDNAEKAPSIVFALQREGGDYQFFGIPDTENWKPAFAAAE